VSLFEKIIRKYGTDLQLEVLIEECAELIFAIQKWKRKKVKTPNANVTERDIISEAVDVEIMIEQLKQIFPNTKLWKEIRKNKLKRMEDRIK